MNVIELFAGAGGAALGLEAAGFSHLGCLEWDPDACSTLRAAGLPAVEGDIRDLSLIQDDWPHCDLLWSSFPCQAWSAAGKRQGAKDERNGWPWTVAAIDHLRERGAGPTWFMGENVVGLTTHRAACEDGCAGPEQCPRAYFDRVILAQLRERFAWVGWRIFNSSSFGVPQHRRRIILCAGPRPIRWPDPTHGDPKAADQGDLFGRRLKTWRTVRDALGPTLREMREAATEIRVIGGGRNPQSSEVAHKRNHRDLTDEPCTTIAASQIGNAGPWVERVPAPQILAITSRQHSNSAGAPVPLDEPLPTLLAGSHADNGFRVHTVNASEREPALGGSRPELADEPCTTIPAVQIGNAGPWMENLRCEYLSPQSVSAGAEQGSHSGLKSSTSTEIRSTSPTSAPTEKSASNPSRESGSVWKKASHPELLDRPSAAVSATEYKGTNGKESTGWTANGGPARASDTLWLTTGRRRLTVQECAVLQDFPRDYPFQGTKTAQYRQVGNAVPPKLAEVVGLAVLQADKEKS